MSERNTRIDVDPRFRRKLKQEAAERDQTVIAFTRDLVEENDPFLKRFIKNEKKKFDFKF